jgi:hypothetical protein
MLYNLLPRCVEIFTGNSENSTKAMQLMERIKEWYFNGKPCDENSGLSMIKCMSDILFHIPITEFVNSRRKNKKALTYFYNFSYASDETMITKTMRRKLTKPGNYITCKIFSWVSIVYRVIFDFLIFI